MSSSPEDRRRYTIVLDLWRAPGEDVENFEGVESPDTMELVDEARFNLDSASRASEAVYWLGQRGWSHYGSYDALILDKSGVTREELARDLLVAGLQRQVVEEYDEATTHKPSRLVHLDPEAMRIEEWQERQHLGHDPEHCPLCLRGGEGDESPPEADSVLQEAEMILAAARFRETVRRTGLKLPEVLALFFGYSQVKQLDEDDLYPLIEQYIEYREDLERRGVIEE